MPEGEGAVRVPPHTDLRLRFRPWRSGRPPASPSPVVSPAPAGMVYVPLQSPPQRGQDDVQKERLPEPRAVREPLLDFASMVSSFIGFA